MSDSKELSRVLEIVLTLFSILRFFFPAVDAYYEEEVMHYISAFDLLLLFWVPVLNIAATWYKKQNLPKWAPPTPIMVLLLSFVVCGIAGGLRFNERGVLGVVWYALGNGAFISVIAISLYDVFSGFCRTQFVAIKELVLRIIAKFKRRKDEEV